MIWPYISLSFLCLLTYGLCDNMRGPLYPELLREFGVSNSLGAWFYAITSIFSTFGSWACIHTLRLMDRVQNVYLALILLSAGLASQALSETFWQLLLASACTGLGLGFLGVSNNILATIGSSQRYRQRILSGLHSMYALSSLVAPLVVTTIYSVGGMWRACFFVASGVSFLVLVGGYAFQKRESPHLEKKMLGNEFEHTPQKNGLKGIGILALGVASYVMAEILVSSRLALYLRVEKSYDLRSSSFYLTGFFIGLLLGRLLFSFYQPKTKLFTQMIASIGLTLVVLVLGLKVHEFFFMLSGFTMGPFYPLAVSYISETFPRMLNPAMAFTISIQSLFVVIMHLTFGWLTDQLGISSAMWFGPTVLILAATLLLGFENWIRPSLKFS